MSAKIEEQWKNDAMRLVFKYLKGKELYNVHLVCKTWCAIGKSLNEKKGPSCKIINKRQEDKYPNFVTAVKDTVQYLVSKPLFCMFITNDALKLDNSERCYCELLQFNCYFIVLKTPVPKNEILTLSSTIFPDLPNIHVTHYTFYTSIVKDEYYCPEIHCYFDYNFLECIHLKHYFDPLFRNKCASKCLIIWCKKSSLKKLTNLVKNIADWYPNNNVVVWGGIAETLTICCQRAYLASCRKNVDFAFFFINDQSIDVESLFLYKNYTDKEFIEEKFTVLRERTTLKKHSIAFMYTSYFRLDDFYELQLLLFEKYFPNVKLVHTIGKEPFGGIGLVELFRKLEKPRLNENTIHTALMIITYN